MRAQPVSRDLRWWRGAYSVSAVGSGIGAGVEYRRKRPVMMSADVVRFAALASVPAAAGFGVLTFGQLCVVGVVQTAGAIAFGAASGAHLKALVPPDRRMAANSRLETTSWIAQTAGPPLGGLLISVAGATVTMAVDAVSFLLSALGMSRLQGPEPAPPDRLASRRLRADLASGWRYIFAHRGLRALFCNAMLFGGPVMMTSALLAVFMLRALGWPRL